MKAAFFQTHGGPEGIQVGEQPPPDEGPGEFCLRGEDNRCVDWHLLGESVRGTLAEYVAVPARNLLRLPAHVTFEAAAARALVFHTAWHSLVTRGALHGGESVLIVGASGGV